MTQTATLPAMTELQQFNQWLVWRYEVRNGEPTKPPFNARTGQLGASNNPDTWCSYEEAVKALDRGGWEGTGWAVTKESGIVPTDLDSCMDLQGNISEWAKNIIARLNTYTEVSPSGTGLRIFARGTLPTDINTKLPQFNIPGIKKEAGIEIYAGHGARFVTVTGNHLPGTPETIEERSDELLAVYKQYKKKPAPKRSKKTAIAPVSLTDQELLQKMFSSKLGSEIQALWNGTHGIEDESRADYDLLSHLAFWTGKDPSRMEYLFNQSSLGDRDKWAERADYRDRTIQAAVNACSEVYDPKSKLYKDIASLDAAMKKHVGQTAARENEQGELPKIILTGLQLREKREQSLAALVQAEERQRRIFIHTHRIVSLSLDKKQRPIMREIETAEMRNHLTDAADFYNAKKINSDEPVLIEVSPPNEIAEAILSLSPHSLPFPCINGITEIPIVRPDGTIWDTQGYDEETGLYYAANRLMQACQIPDIPTKEDVQQARNLLDQCFGEFCYETQADYANYMGLLITIVTRYMYTGDVQHAIASATKPGTGKTLLVHGACIIATGVTAPIRDFPQKEEETKKVIDAKILGGQNIIIFDNVKRRIESSALDALATGGGRYSLRPLGQSKDIIVENVRCTVMLTGNNIQLDTDQARRCFIIRLTSPVSKPDEREDFSIKDLLKHCIDNRPALVRALLILVRAWFVAGSPAGTNKVARSASTFNFWAKTVGGILEHAGIEGFLDNRDSLRADANEEETQTDAFLHAWKGCFGEDWIPAKQLVEKICQVSEGLPATLPANPLFEAMPDALKIAMQEKPKSFTMIFSKWLQKRIKTPYGDDNIRIERDEDKHTKSKIWRVVAGSAGSQYTPLKVLRERNSLSSSTVDINTQAKGLELTTRTTRNGKVEKIDGNGLNGSTSGLMSSPDLSNLAGSSQSLPAMFNSGDRVNTPEGPATVRFQSESDGRYCVHVDEYDPKVGRSRGFAACELTLLQEVTI